MWLIDEFIYSYSNKEKKTAFIILCAATFHLAFWQQWRTFVKISAFHLFGPFVFCPKKISKWNVPIGWKEGGWVEKSKVFENTQWDNIIKILICHRSQWTI